MTHVSPEESPGSLKADEEAERPGEEMQQDVKDSAHKGAVYEMKGQPARTGEGSLGT